MDKEILNIRELAEYFGVSETLAYRLAHTDGFPVLRIGKRLMVPVAELRIWVSRNVVCYEK